MKEQEIDNIILDLQHRSPDRVPPGLDDLAVPPWPDDGKEHDHDNNIQQAEDNNKKQEDADATESKAAKAPGYTIMTKKMRHAGVAEV